MNLIERLGGYEKAKNHRDYLASYGLEFAGVNQKEINELNTALLKYRRQHNIFEPDDYIIHDGELKVFAMWSSAVEGCAYIGYAYAENGEMAHKDEFRHATDAEIKAGKRLEVESEN
ncbi:hypothetical protein N5B96_08490 [Acinetobacter johnsonii]|uniref:hypothetical protein n=1 Tax=Acinetobacter johnsonii TaxID=40214 RepID=UPI00244BDF43|nr:hypothetical protein [Acinetobacter johnsonii]MDH1069520.1 hypothetical protein [Acinetobacter johnsonii]